MAGTLTISTLSDGTNSTSSTNCIKGSAKAWVNFTGTNTPSVSASYNISSVTFISNWIWQVNFTNATADANYAVAGSAQFVAPADGAVPVVGVARGTTPTTTNFRVQPSYQGLSYTSCQMIHCVVFSN